MGELPSAASLKRRIPDGRSPGIRVPSVDFSGIARAGKSISAGLDVAASAGADVDDYETKKRLLDFKLQTEMELDGRIRSIEPGGAALSATWDHDFRRRAREFVGKDDANIPEAQRAQVGLLLKQHEVMLRERAMRAEEKERDRYEVESLGASLESRRSAVASDPSTLDRYKQEAVDLIDQNPRLSPVAKASLKKEYLPGLIEESYRSRAQRATTPEEYKAILDELKPDMPDREAVGGSGLARALAQRRQRFFDEIDADPELAATVRGIIASENGEHPEGILESMMNRADMRGRKSLWDEIKSGFYGPYNRGEVRPRGAGYEAAFAKVRAGSSDIGLLTDQGLRNEHKPAASVGVSPTQINGEWYSPMGRDGLEWKATVEKEAAKAGKIALSKVAAYDGPHAELTQKQRRKLYNVIVDDQNKALAGLREEVKTSLESEVEAVRRTGKSSPNAERALNTARLLLNPNQLRAFEIDRAEAEYEFQLLGGIERLTPDAIADKLQRVKPDAGEMSFKAHAKAFDKALRFADELQKLRDTDPAAAVDPGIRTSADQPAIPTRLSGRMVEADPDIEKVREAKGGSHAIMSARMAAQARIGIPPEQRSPITKAEAMRLLVPVAGLKGEDLAEPFTDLAIQIHQQYGDHAPAVLSYLARTVYRDRASQEIVNDELQKVLKKPGMAVMDAKKLKELEDINAHEDMRRKGWQGTSVPTSRPSQAHIMHLIKNPNLAPFFDKKFGAGAAMEILKAAGASAP